MKFNFTRSLLLVLSITLQSVYAQDDVKKVNVTGTILAAEKSDGISKGDPLVGVTISIKGTTKGTVTDIDGNFKLENVPVGAKLIVSYIGFATQELEVTEGKTDFNVPLKLDSKELEEVVAVGYAVQKKRDVTGATVSVGEKEMKQTINTGLDQALQGRTPGVTVVQTSGQPGAAASVNIRGVGSINGGQPLYVIDGMPIEYNNINLINPNDIETMEVLKDASAAAIYGARAANGVVMITTKRGKEGKGTVEYSSQGGIQNAWKRLDVLNAQQYRNFYADLYGSSAQKAYTSDSLIPFQANTDWQDQVFTQGAIQDHSLTARGGNEYAKYSIGLGYFEEKGTLIKSNFKRYSFRANTEIKPKKWLTISETFTFARSEFENGMSATNQLGAATRTAPLIPVYSDDPRNIGGYGGQILGVTGNNDGINPVANTAKTTNKDVRNRLLGNLSAEVEFIKNLKFKTFFGADFLFRDDNNIGQPFYYGPTQDRNRILKTVSYDRGLNLSWTFDNTVSYSKKIGRHDFSLLGGYSSQYFFSSGFSASGASYPEQINTIGASLLPSSYNVGGSNSEAALAGFLARATYNYNDILLFTANARYDGSSRFGQNYKYGFFPSASGGWRISNMEFMKNYQWISELKLRVGVGRTGNQDLSNINGGDYLFTQALYTDIIRYPLGTSQTILPGAAPTRGLANPNLRWETVDQYNAGVDFTVLQNSLSLVLDAYIKESSGILIPVPIPAVSGVTDAPFFRQASYFTNAGSVRNTGLEGAITYRNERNAFKFSVTPNATIVKNEVVRLEGQFGGGRPNIVANDGISRTEEGMPIGSFYGYVTDGVIQDSSQLNSYVGYLSRSHNASVGDLRFKDLNGDGRIDGNDRTFLGKPIPTISYGLNFRASYQNFDLNLFLQGVEGVQVYNAQRREMESMIGIGTGFQPDANQSVTVLDRWTPDNPSSTMPRASLNDVGQNTRPSNRWVENADYLRLKNIQLGYNFPEKLLKRAFRTQDGVSLRIYISSQNLLTITNYKGYDPEIASVNAIETGVDRGSYPQSRKFMGGIQFTF